MAGADLQRPLGPKTKKVIVMKVKRNILSWLGAASLCLAVGMGVSGCTNELDPGFGQMDLGEKVHGTLSVPLGSSSPTTVSRAVDFSEKAMVKIDCYWIGVYDSKTGELVGTKTDMVPRKSDGTRWTLRNDNDTPFTAEDIDIYYYEHNPYAYIVGVVNFNGVEGKLAGETENKPLKDLLEEAKTFSDVTKIVVDTKSADKANRDRGSDEACPVMMGFYSTAQTAVHAMVNPDGSIYQSPYTYPYYPSSPSTDENYTDNLVVRLTGSGADLNLSGGAIRLQRLLAEINVGVTSGYRNSSYQGLVINSVQYKVVNKPLDVYLMEHSSDANAYQRTSKEDYLTNTANVADYYDDRYESDGDFRYASSYTDNQTGQTIFQFSYQHYENKHIGYPWWAEDQYYYGDNHYWREKLWDDTNVETGKSGIYRSLCPSIDQPWNNNASYIILRVNFDHYYDNTWYESGSYENGNYSNKNVTVDYIIHEGYTSLPDGQDANSNPYSYYKVLDYQTVRNTQYFYGVTINGEQQLEYNVTASDYDDYPPHNDGISGEENSMDVVFINNANPGMNNYYMNSDDIANRSTKKWIFVEKTPSGTNYWGTWTAADGELYYDNINYEFNIIPSNIKPADEMPEELKNAFKVTKSYGNNSEPYSLTLQEFIDLPDDDDWWNNANYLYYIIAPYTLYGDDQDYDKLSQYRRYFLVIDTEKADADGCKIGCQTLEYVQKAYDDRFKITNIGLRSHSNTSGHWNPNLYGYDNPLYWCGAPGTVTWLYFDITYQGTEGHPGNNMQNTNYKVDAFDIQIGNKTYHIAYEDIKYGQIQSSGSNGVYSVTISYYCPVYIDNNTNYGSSSSGYGYMNVKITPIVSDPKYRPVESQSFSRAFFMQRKSTSTSNGYQWLFASVSSSTYGYTPLWDYYSDSSRYGYNAEIGGLSVTNGTSGTSYRAIQASSIGGQDAIYVGGSGTVGSYLSGDKLTFSFWVDRPGTLKLSYGFPSGTAQFDLNSGSAPTRYWAAAVRGTQGDDENVVKWVPLEASIGQCYTEATAQLGELKFPETNENGTFEPVEVVIYLKGGGGYIRSIEFRPNN